MSSVAGDIGVTASGTNSVSPTRQRDSFEGPLHVSDAVQWIAAKNQDRKSNLRHLEGLSCRLEHARSRAEASTVQRQLEDGALR